MLYNVKVEACAKKDFAEAHRYYFKISRKTATSFGKDVKAAIGHLEVNPFYELRTTRFRAIPLKKFPFLLFFEVNEQAKEVKVVAIFNTNQDTEKYPK
jgi:hypothetical protein